MQHHFQNLVIVAEGAKNYYDDDLFDLLYNYKIKEAMKRLLWCKVEAGHDWHPLSTG